MLSRKQKCGGNRINELAVPDFLFDFNTIYMEVSYLPPFRREKLFLVWSPEIRRFFDFSIWRPSAILDV